jgi:ribosomal-protein-alanine N-acetyltransferase
MPAAPETLSTPRYRLEQLGRADRDALMSHFGDPAVSEYMDLEPPIDGAKIDGILAWLADNFAKGSGVRWAIRERESGAFVGTCGFNSIIRERGSRAEVAFDLVRSSWGQGVMREVLTEVIDVGFGAIGVQRIEAFVNPGNHRSCRLLTRFGFREEGRLRDYGYWRGQFWDQLVFSLLRHEWSRAARPEG